MKTNELTFKEFVSIATISGHLKGIADGLLWYVTPENQNALERAHSTLKQDAAHLRKILNKLTGELND